MGYIILWKLKLFLQFWLFIVFTRIGGLTESFAFYCYYVSNSDFCFVLFTKESAPCKSPLFPYQTENREIQSITCSELITTVILSKNAKVVIRLLLVA